MIALLGIIGLIVLFSTIIAAYNHFTDPVLRSGHGHLDNLPLVSILIPARNEANNIAHCVRLASAQTYPTTEILVLDDNSEDATLEIVQGLANLDSRIRLIRGAPLPERWLGKNWACHQLARDAHGDLLLFIDADVRLAPRALAAAVSHYQTYGISLLSLFPTQEIYSLGEWLIVPLMNWLLLSFLPLWSVYRSPHPSLVAANGQFMLIGKCVYDILGGHETISVNVVEDMELARLAKSSGYRIMTLLGGDLVSCAMYSNIRQAISGFTKNFYPGFRTSPVVFLLILLLAFFSYTSPFILILEDERFIFILALIITGRIFISRVSCQNTLLNILLHPAQIGFMLFIGIRSVIASSKGNLAWKGRRV